MYEVPPTNTSTHLRRPIVSKMKDLENWRVETDTLGNWFINHLNCVELRKNAAGYGWTIAPTWRPGKHNCCHLCKKKIPVPILDALSFR